MASSCSPSGASTKTIWFWWWWWHVQAGAKVWDQEELCYHLLVIKLEGDDEPG